MLAPDNRGSKVIVKNWTDVVIPIYNWTEYSDIYSKILGNLCQYYGDEPALYNTGNIFYFSANSNSILFKLKKNDKLKRQWWQKICLNNGSIKIS